MENNCANCRSCGPDKMGHTHAPTHARTLNSHYNNCMSRSPQVGLTKKKKKKGGGGGKREKERNGQTFISEIKMAKYNKKPDNALKQLISKQSPLLTTLKKKATENIVGKGALSPLSRVFSTHFITYSIFKSCLFCQLHML